MVVDDDQSRRVEDERTLHHLARIYRRVIDRPALKYLVGNKGVLAIKKQHPKLLDLLVSHRRLQVVYERPPVAEHGTAAHFRAGHAAGDFPDKAQERHVASRQPEGTKLRRLGRYDMPNTGKVLQESGGRRRALPESQQPVSNSCSSGSTVARTTALPRLRSLVDTSAFIDFLVAEGLRMQPTSHAAMSGDEASEAGKRGVGAGRSAVTTRPPLSARRAWP